MKNRWKWYVSCVDGDAWWIASRTVLGAYLRALLTWGPRAFLRRFRFHSEATYKR